MPTACRACAAQIERLKERKGLTEKEVQQLCTKAKEVLAPEQVIFHVGVLFGFRGGVRGWSR